MGFYYKNQSVAVRHDGLVFQCVEGTLKSRSTYYYTTSLSTIFTNCETKGSSTLLRKQLV